MGLRCREGVSKASAYQRRILAGLALAIILLCAAGAIFYGNQERRIIGAAEKTLSAISELKERQVADWLAREMRASLAVSASAHVRSAALSWLETHSLNSEKALREGLESVRANFEAQALGFTDLSGSYLVSGDSSQRTIAPETRRAMETSASTRAPALSDLYLDAGTGKPFLDIAAPMFSSTENASPILGFALAHIDPSRFLYPLIQSWPTPDRTAESLLVRRDGNDALFLNELKYREDSALRLRIPMSEQDIVAVKAIAGKSGIVSGKDYRGVRVLADVRNVTGTDWRMINKIDETEALSAWRSYSSITVVMFCVLGFGIIVMAALLLEYRSRRHYESLYSAEAELHGAQERYRTTLMSVGDGVISTDSRGIVEFMNAVAENLTGWKSEEGVGRDLDEILTIIDEPSGQRIESPVSRVMTMGAVIGLPERALLIAKDGKKLPIADSGAPIRDAAGGILGVVFVFRDQTGEKAIRDALKDSEARLRNVNDSSVDFIYSYDLQGRFTSVNRSLCESMGLPPDAIIGKTHRELGFPSEQCDEWACLHRKVIETGKTVTSRTSTSTLPSETKHWEVLLNPLRDDAGATTGIMGITRDITESHISAIALKESELRLEAFMRYSPALMYMKDAELRSVYINSRMRELLPVDEWMGRRPEEIFDSAKARATIERDLEAFAKGAVEYEEDYRDKRGDIHTFLTTKFRIDLPEKPSVLGAISIDVSEWKKAVRQLSELGEVFRLILAHSPIHVFVKDQAGRVVYLSDNYVDLIGIPSEDAIGKSMDQIFPPELATSMMEDDRRVMREGKPVEIVEELAGKIYSSLKFPILIDGEPKFLVGYTMDITERTLALREIERMNETLEQRVRERTELLNAANKELEAFSYSVSHDLRSPLRALDGFSHCLAQEYASRLDEQGLHYLDRIQDAARRMGQLISDLLDMARITRTDFERKPVDLSVLAAAAVEALRSENPGREMEIAIESGLVASGNANLLAIAMDNLIGNAWKFTGATPRAKIEFGRSPTSATSVASEDPLSRGRETEYFVRDNGVGFDMAYVDKLFKPFQRLHGKNEFSGTGIGLATVQRIVERHGGRIRAEASPGAGACFYFTLGGAGS